MMKIATGLILIALPFAAHSAECNCQEIIGSCMGSIEFVKSFGTKPSYGAEIIVHSSEKQCSKVEYFVDSTPYQTILVNRRSELDSLFGTKPILEKNITFSSCKICTLASDRKNNTSQQGIIGDERAPQASLDLSGRWSSQQICDYGRGTSEMEITYDKSHGTISGRLANASIDSGTITGTLIRISASNWLGNRVEMEGIVIAPNRIKGTYTQSARSGSCTWDAIKIQ